MDERAQRAVRVAAIAGLLSLVVFATFHEPTRFTHTLQKLAHPVTFGAVALLWLTLLPRQAPRRGRTYVAAFALTVLCGAGTEVAQAFVNRDPAVLDVLRDALGACTALLGFATIIPGSDSPGQPGWRLTGGLFALLGFGLMVAPISLSLAAYARRDLSFPTLLEACSPLDRYFVAGGGGAALTIVASKEPTTSSCGRAFRVSLGAARYPGIELNEPYPDWRAAKTLILDLRNPGTVDLPLVIRVHDRGHNYQFHDRFNREFTLRASERLEYAIPIVEIEHAPAGRLMDLSRIASLAVFRARGTEVSNFDLERILLQR